MVYRVLYLKPITQGNFKSHKIVDQIFVDYDVACKVAIEKAFYFYQLICEYTAFDNQEFSVVLYNGVSVTNGRFELIKEVKLNGN